MKKAIYLTAIIIFMSSCNNFGDLFGDDNNSIAYYNFKDSDLNKLLDYKINDSLVFVNQLNEKRKFLILNSKKAKRRYSVGMGFFGGGAASYFYYDEKEIEIESLDSIHLCFDIRFSRWPIDTDQAKDDYYKEFPSKLNGYLKYFPYWNGEDSYIDIIDLRIKTNLNIKGKIYNNVIILKSDNNQIIIGNNYNKDVHIIYYDEKYGIIGFDDLNGNEWRIKI
ncbi:MAG: hypothetical protein V3V28_06070 [Polaribacter sp.]|uniref:hypothetical protein n=1 Tax=Polaribacter sp. TaxID=1920175 RepID=UPI002F353489